MKTCASCGNDLPGEFPFCPFCGAAAETPPTAAVREERKIVTVLFCDLVGFTAASEAADPEDVRSRLSPYHARLRRELERYGGTVEKFIGDAVMAVFGAPVAHEDDAERAVRAGLRILEEIEELNAEDPALALQVRVGINTAEGVVSVGARPELGEGFVTGDVVNTASRLQGAAPVNGIACSEQTYRATERIFDYEELEPVAVKGKSEPLRLFRPSAPLARFGTDVTRTHTTPLVGRDLEKPLLIGTFERSAQQRSCQVVTIVGEPGVGKSRLCAELFGYIEDRPGLVRWRQGRCLPYGEGIAFWALGEIVKAECGILESDTAEEADSKLERVLDRDDPDFAWLRARLAPLVGVGGEPAEQEESFAAWRRFLESLATDGPAVLVFEDLHWADPALLAFVEYLAEWAEGVPLLLLCTARPELYEQHPTFGAKARNAQRINLPPLTDDETARLIASLLEQSLLPAETQQALLERAGGNPLYAEEFVRLLADRGQLGEDVEIPESVQALIAARLDTLPPERKSLLQDAAVIGKVFWTGAVAEMGGRDPGEVEQELHELARKELVRPVRSSSMEGESEYGFWHLLVRDVCYAQIPRAGRAARHRAAAAWIERKAGERVEDLADVLAQHYLTALELARAAGFPDEVAELEPAAIRYLALAGERALPLDVEHAEESLAKALALAPEGHPERASLLERWARGAQQRGRHLEAKEALEEAVALHRESGEKIALARALTALSSTLRQFEGAGNQEEAIAEAIALLEAEPPGPELVAALTELAALRSITSAASEAITTVERALALAAELGLPEPPASLGTRGISRSYFGDHAGLQDLRRALTLALKEGQGRPAAVMYNNLAVATWVFEGPEAGRAVCTEGIEFCERRGIVEFALAIAAMRAAFLAELGLAEQALVDVQQVVGRMQGAADSEPQSVRLRVLLERGTAQQEPDVDQLVADVRGSGEAQLMAMMFTVASRLLLARGRPREALALLAELEQVSTIGNDPYYSSVVAELQRTALALGEPQLAARLAASVEPRTPLAQHALATNRAQLAEAAGDPGAAVLYGEAAEGWRSFGNVPERAYALLGQGRCLASLGEPKAEWPLREARELFASMGYAPALAEADALLGESEVAASTSSTG